MQDILHTSRAGRLALPIRHMNDLTLIFHRELELSRAW